MAVSPDYRAFIEELFDGIVPVRIRSMFGGAGVYAGEVMFGLIADDCLYLKADETSATAFEAEGGEAFTYHPRGADKPHSMSYWSLPERLYDEPGELKIWALRALDVAMKSKRPKSAKPRKKPSPRKNTR